MATVLTNTGKADMINALNGGAHTAPQHVGWGTGAGTSAEANTTLFTEASETRVSGTKSVETTTVTNDTYQVIATITADGTKTITNAGLFDAVSAGDLYVKGDFTGIPLTLGDSIQFTITIVQDQV
ncbi:MAG: hypothetical protein KAS32_22025 [Candidatus Peribacteraceae bacterium]|nr:hypothetical protein [Candidatus Peribacteraceae bacterium]